MCVCNNCLSKALLNRTPKTHWIRQDIDFKKTKIDTAWKDIFKKLKNKSNSMESVCKSCI